MKCYFGHLIKEGEKDEYTGIITYIGRYGEDLMFSKHPDGMYTLSCSALDLWDIIMPEISKNRIINSYAIEGNNDYFNKERKSFSNSVSTRLYELGTTMFELYKEYQTFKDPECFKLIKQIIKDVEVFKLNKTKYIDWFVTFGSTEHWNYIHYILNLRKRIIKTRKYVFKITYEYKCPIKEKSHDRYYGNYKVIAKTKIEAIIKFRLVISNSKNYKKIDLFKKEEAVYGDESIQS